MPFLYFSIEIDNKGQRFMRPGENRPRTLKDNCMSKAMRAHAAQHVKEKSALLKMEWVRICTFFEHWTALG
jgi:hypothetical protein